MTFQNPNRTQIGELLAQAQTIAVVGLSANPAKPSFDVATALQRYGYRVVPVSPSLTSWQGIPAFSTLAEAKAGLGPTPIDIVDAFRQSQFVAGIVDECISLKLPVLWLQLGVIDEAAALRAQSAGMTVVMDKCIKVERMRL
ncbi:MAG TPA: CoA-binding protein [Steroidobacteraceae bacterium]|nr:CoA-binding protein [Steroidobacteraceae bacterium]